MASTYSVGLLRDFLARHMLIGGDWGRENEPHAHHYRLEAVLKGEELDRHGYLVDSAEVEPRLDALVERYRDKMLNELPEFRDLNPSLERFAAVLGERLARELAGATGVRTLTITLWESERAYATWRRAMS